jgi:phage baseplate assembly protein W
MTTFDTEYSDVFAYDMHKDARTEGDALNEDAINLSIENILSTNKGERPFLPEFGSILPTIIFETINQVNGERILEDIVESIKSWETRITLLEERIRMDVRLDQNALLLVIPYRINQNGLTGTFSRKILL